MTRSVLVFKKGGFLPGLQLKVNNFCFFFSVVEMSLLNDEISLKWHYLSIVYLSICLSVCLS